MAQALFDEHPLEQYLRDVGETQETMPGSSADLLREIDTDAHLYINISWEDEVEWRPEFWIRIEEVINSWIEYTHPANTPSNPFIERFKYNVISSLLATNLSNPHSKSNSRRFSIPGKLQHSRASSIDTQPVPLPPLSSTDPDPHYALISLCIVLIALFLSGGYSSLAFLSFIPTSFLIFKLMSPQNISKTKVDMTPTLDTLDDLIIANNSWESLVGEAVNLIEKDDRSVYYGASSPSSPTSSIRIAINSSLQTAQSQCDNVRQLLSALTCPSELAQLSEMYAPPSPIRPGTPSDMSTRPFSYPGTKSGTWSLLQPKPGRENNKRFTWNGSLSNHERTVSPLAQDFAQRERRLSNLSSSSSSVSGPATPAITSPTRLTQVREDAESKEPTTPERLTMTEATFGVAALELHRKRRSDGIEAFRTPPPSYFQSLNHNLSMGYRSPRSSNASPTVQSASRFTTMQTTRHPLSVSALKNVLQGALASKRYTCSHLLALRFSEEEDEGYWEDVRSVMSLLTSTFVDASARLADALEAMERQKLRDQTPTPIGIEGEVPSSDDEAFVRRLPFSGADKKKRRSRLDSQISFAPMPSHLSRFAAHISAISSALEDAKEHLDQCVAVLNEDSDPFSDSPTQTQTRSETAEDEKDEHMAIQAYERLRHELGVALRECERGRGLLEEIVRPPVVVEDEEEDVVEEHEDLPALGHDASDDSDKPEPEDVVGDLPSNSIGTVNVHENLDDASIHLLISTTTQHLPPPGLEQVFEADSASTAAFSRERSKLTREERIALRKAKRESGFGVTSRLGMVSDDATMSGTESIGGGIKEMWGPGGEVVQELKDVIWKVGERRRKLGQSNLADSDS